MDKLPECNNGNTNGQDLVRKQATCSNQEESSASGR